MSIHQITDERKAGECAEAVGSWARLMEAQAVTSLGTRPDVSRNKFKPTAPPADIDHMNTTTAMNQSIDQIESKHLRALSDDDEASTMGLDRIIADMERPVVVQSYMEPVSLPARIAAAEEDAERFDAGPTTIT